LVLSSNNLYLLPWSDKTVGVVDPGRDLNSHDVVPRDIDQGRQLGAGRQQRPVHPPGAGGVRRRHLREEAGGPLHRPHQPPVRLQPRGLHDHVLQHRRRRHVPQEPVQRHPPPQRPLRLVQVRRHRPRPRRHRVGPLRGQHRQAHGGQKPGRREEGTYVLMFVINQTDL
ncbi:unnamed protein product, partial [Linum tenue]